MENARTENSADGAPDLLLINLRTIGTHHCDQTVGEEAAQEIERLREANAEMQKQIARAWNDGFDFAMKGCGWQEGEDPSTEGLYVVRDSKGNVEVGMWYAKTLTQPAEWTREFRDVDRDDIVAWMAIPDWRTARNAYKLADAALAQEDRND